TLNRTNSVAISVKRSLRPSAQRYSIATVRPFIHPSSSNRFSNAAVHGAHTAGVAAPKNPMVGSRPVRCARADNGHAAAPRSTMNSRRRIAPPKAQDYGDLKVGLEQGFGNDEMGFRGQFARQQSSGPNVRFGSKADIG